MPCFMWGALCLALPGRGACGQARFSMSEATWAPCPALSESGKTVDYRRCRAEPSTRGGCSPARSKKSPHEAGFPEGRSTTPTHHVEEVQVGLARLHLVEHELHRLDLVHRIEQLAQDPGLLEHLRLEEQLLAARAALVDEDRGIDALLGHAAIQVDLAVAG